MKYTETIEELEGLTNIYMRELKEGFDIDYRLNSRDIKWREDTINNIACAINVLKDNET